MRIQALVSIVAAIAAFTAAVSGPNRAISMGSGASATPQPAGKFVDIVDVINLKHSRWAEGRT